LLTVFLRTTFSDSERLLAKGTLIRLNPYYVTDTSAWVKYFAG
jgi:hypothetical protein